MSYRTVLADVTEAREPLIRLWSENLHVSGNLDDKLRWFYLDGPWGRGEAFLLRAADDAVVGCAGLSLREMLHGDATVRAALLADFVIDKRHRSALPALTLQRAVKRHTDAAYDLSYGFPNQGAVAVLLRIGYRELGKMARYVRVLRYAPYLTRRYGRPLLSRAAAIVVDPASVAITAARSIASRAHARLEWLPDFDDRFDRLWEVARPRDLIACRRSSQFLRWRFARKPDERNAIAALVERRGDALAGYAVVRGAPGDAAELVDLFAKDLATTDVLLGQLIPALYLRGHTSVSFRYLGDPRLVDVLARHWFSLRDAKRVIIVNRGPSCPLADTVAYDARHWYLTDLDEDT